MTRTVRTAALMSVAAASLLAGLSGCQSERERTRNEVLSQASSFRDQLNTLPAEIDETTRRLVAATAGQNPNRANDFREFNRSLETLRQRAQVVAREANLAEVDSARYFTAWAREIRRTPAADRPATREAAALSRAQVEQGRSLLDAARRDFTDLITAYDNVSTRLSADLSEQAVIAAQPDVQNAIRRSLDVRNRIDRLDDVIDAALTAQ